MLKKLVKYGNSNALILDRAILELLNIGEGAVVKLHTDGKSLTITPQENAVVSNISMSGVEKLFDVIDTKMTKELEEINADPVKKEQAQQWMPGSENGEKLTQLYKAIMDKYREDVALTMTPDFLEKVDELAARYNNNRADADFIKDYLALRLEYAPNLVAMDKEMAEASKSLGMPDYL
jgi:antitoxin component of MazEF toxin-antitoxin module